MRRSALSLTILLVVSFAGSAPIVTGSTAAQTGIAPANHTTTSTQEQPVCAGLSDQRANGITVVSAQGARGREKRPARLIAYGPHGEILWTFDASEELGVVWSYDVDPLGNGNLFVTATRPGRTLLYELNTTTGGVVWTEQLPYTDTHDADPLNRTHVVIANMRNYNDSSGENEDRLVVYDRRTDTVTWEWQFDDRSRYDEATGGDYTDDWTHVNDVDRVGPNRFLVSPRNFDQVLLVNRTTGGIDLRLGADDQLDVLHEQHNPDYLTSDENNPTFLVADSENDRVVEYAHRDGEWTRTWSLGDEETLAWPRDADRLRNGHTLIGDSRNHRVIEVTPRGEVVWEAYAPWLVYDVERIPIGGFDSDAYRDLGGSRGPTMADLRATAGYSVSNADPPAVEALEACAGAIRDHENGFGSVDLGSDTPTASQTPFDDTPTGSQTPASETDATTPSDDPRPSTVATPIRSPTPDSLVPVPGFGPLLAVLAVGTLGALLARRR